MASLLSHLPHADSVNTVKTAPGRLTSSSTADSSSPASAVRQCVTPMTTDHAHPDPGLILQAELLINEAVEKALKTIVDDVQLWYLNL
jgi:hypothetical protein